MNKNKVKIKKDALVGQNMTRFNWKNEEIIFEIDTWMNEERAKLIAPGYGLLPNAYGNGAVFANKNDLIHIENEENKNIRKLSEQTPRVETGNTQFGDDWVGLFIRGDNCFYYADNLRKVLAKVSITTYQREALDDLLKLLQNTKEK